MCDICADFSELLNNYNDKLNKLDGCDLPLLNKREIDQVFTFIQTWVQRQCFCCFRDPKNYEKFHLITSSIILLVVKQLQAYKGEDVIESEDSQNDQNVNTDKEKSEVKIVDVTEVKEETEENKNDERDKSKDTKPASKEEEKRDVWTIQDMEKLLHFLSKVFLLNFPLYAAYKQSFQTKMEELTQQEAQALSSYCDVHDLEIPIHLLRNVSLFCRSGGVQAMTACFEHQSLPLPVAHAIISVVCNLKLWLNFRSIMQLFVPLRSKVLKYMCNMADKDLRSQGIKAMADFMWSAVKDPMDAPVQFDRDGLNLAFKYFTSSTLTMRLAGISQINSHINTFNEMCNSENIMEVETVGQSLATWLIDNNIISQIFGPNLHVEVIKQSHIILSFLAMECKITNEHMDIIWAAAQLKHCSRQVHDLLPPLIKHLEAGPVLHLYHLLSHLPPREHSEQSLFLASAIIKFLWTSNGSYSGMGEGPGQFVCLPGYTKVAQHQMSSSDNTNSEGDSSEGHKSDSEGSDGPTPRKRQKQRKPPVVGGEESSDADESIKIEDLEEEEEVASVKESANTTGFRRMKRKMSRRTPIEPKIVSQNIKLDKEMVTSTQQDRLKIHRHQKVIQEKLKESEQPKDENSNSVKIEECSEEEEEDDDEEEEEEESESEEEGVMLGGHIATLNPEVVKVVTDQEVPNIMLRQGSDYIQLVSGQSPDCGQTAVMTELASLVQNAPHCRPFISANFPPPHEIMEEILSVEDGDGDGSLSSRMSNKSEKNMADFDGEESGCDEEMAQFAARAQMLQAHLTPQQLGQMARLHANKVAFHHLAPLLSQFNLENVCKPGNTLLWDLLQDDKINQLGEGLALEAEKVLCNLLCFNTDKLIRMKFVEGCLDNLAKHRSVIVSLRLLPKLFASFQHIRGGSVDTHHVTLWALKEHSMMERFFENLKVSTAAGPLPLTHVQVRLQFLTHIYSPLGLPDCIRLSVEELDTLWQCLAGDMECSDEFFSWLLRQAKSKEQHALRPDTLRHLYTRKLSTLQPETISMTALNLYQQLCNMARSSDTPNMDHLWKIALRVNNTDVSMAAIQYLNHYYMSQQLERESEFVSQCMANLTQATQDLATHEEASLLCIQRALLLLNTHLDTFKRRYAFHLRRWTIEGHQSLTSHVIGERDRGAVIKIVVQPAGVQDKVSLEMLSSDYVAELRAEVTVWWESLGNRGLEGPIRIITQGQELTTECDEKTLADIGFKDMQMVYISVGASRQKKRGDGDEMPSVLPPPPRECLPTLLLLLPPWFEQLFTLMQTLSAMKIQVKGGHHIPHTKAQVLSRRVWDILTMLPTGPSLLGGFQQLDCESKLCQLLDPASPQKLMYSLYIVESLSRNPSLHKKQFPDEVVSSEVIWSEKFVQHGGLRHLFDIFLSGVLQVAGGSEWQQDCLACLLKLLCQLGMMHSTDELSSNKPKRKRCPKSDKMVIPKLSPPMVHLMNLETVIPQLTSILYEASMPRDPNHYKTGFWGRAQVVQYAMALIVSWAGTVSGVRERLYEEERFQTWLRRLVLEEPEPSVRREVCMALYRLAAPPHAPTMLTHLLDLLEKAEAMRPPKQEGLHMQPMPEDGKEPYGPACRDYFWLLCRLVDSLSAEDVSKDGVDLEKLASRVCQSIIQREFLETRHNTMEDDGLIGLLNLMSNILKHNPSFKTAKEGQTLLNEVFEFLFALPDPSNRQFPKCKSQASRSSAYDLLVELVKGARTNYRQLHDKLLNQHKPGPHSPYPWDYWPHEDGRSDCGYVGLTNLGATCYMASCMQHLYMMPQARAEILRADADKATSKHQLTLRELQRMFAYLQESERKAYNPRSFCKVYTMDHQPLNTGEQKDMAEFFIDLVSKLEEMTPELKKLVKTLFGGVISNNVVSLDCDHVSRTVEEFYTVRCQVADMRNLYESLDEVTVKDTLEGDNMYTCSHCGKKVRAEKRACFKKLPNILCFNTMRYTFNMVTMLKEKVNTHFSFPLRLDMSGYVEKHLMPQQYEEEKDQENKDGEKGEEAVYEYELIGVTVHTGTADGGHYYSFIRDRARDKWFLFNDAEVKQFDPKQIAAECFGGEMTSKTYDSVTDKFMDLSFEKTNSAYMLFYERAATGVSGGEGGSGGEMVVPTPPAPQPIALSPELEGWIWQDNMHFLRDKNIFEHTYVQFMWQICGYVPQTLDNPQEVIEIAAELSTTFFIETFIHAKEKPTMVQWVELLTKQFNTSQVACEWFLQHMAHNNWWPVQILIKCPNQIVRQMFQRLCQHVIQLLRSSHAPLFLKMDSDDEGLEECDPDKIGYLSCVTMFIRMLLSLMEHGAKPHLKHLTEYFALLYEFSKMGEDESQFLISIHAISTMVNFYLGQKSHDYVEVVSEEEEEEEVVPLMDKYKPQSLDKMITLVALLVEKSRGPDHRLRLSTADYSVIAGTKGFPFLFQQIKDCINLHQTRNLIFSVCRWNERLASHIVGMIFSAIHKFPDMCQPFWKLLTLVVEAGPAGLPNMTELVLGRLLEVMDVTPQSALDWLAMQVPRNKSAHNWVMAGLDNWLHHYLLAHNNQRVRSAAAYLLVALVPGNQFRQCYRAARPHKDAQLAPEAQAVLHQVYTVLLRLLKTARLYTDINQHGSTKLVAYFTLLNYFAISRAEKLMFGPYLMDLWQLFHPKLSEPGIPVHHNKQALLMFWNHVSIDCPENVQLILQNGHIIKNIAFNYILADHDDQDVVLFNRAMLPAYYGLLRLCCQQSRAFTRQLATHQNLTWAFKNITPHPTQYAAAVDELFKLMALFASKYSDSTEQEIIEINAFRKSTLQLYIQFLDGRSSWATLISAFRILVENDEDRVFVLYNHGLQLCFESLHTLHVMYHEATACHVTADLLELLTILVDLAKCLRNTREPRNVLLACKDWSDILRKLVTLLNTYNSNEMRTLCIDLLKELVLLAPTEVLGVLVPVLSHCHAAFQDNTNAMPMGPYFPRPGHKLPPLGLKAAARPLRPMVQMAVPHNQIDAAKGMDPEYDQALLQFYAPYHSFIDVMCRLAINNNCMTENLVNLSAMVGFEAVPLHLTLFPKLWLDIYQAQNVDRKYIAMLTNSTYFADYVESVLLDERPSLNIDIIYEFLVTYFPKVASPVLTDPTCQLMETLVNTLGKTLPATDLASSAYKLNGELRALSLVYSVELGVVAPPDLLPTLNTLLAAIDRETATEESPTKKRKLDTEKKPDSTQSDKETTEKSDESKKEENIQATASCSKDKDVINTSEDSETSSPEVDWLDRLKSTVTSLISALQQKNACDDSS